MAVAIPRQLGSIAETDGIRVEVTPTFLPEQSDTQGSNIKTPLFVFGYHVRIINNGIEPVKLLSRHWEIVDADGERKIVEGEGVIGMQPEIPVGEGHAYQSFCQLHTDWGTMEGYYVMQSTSGRRFNAAIGRFYLVGHAANEQLMG